MTFQNRVTEIVQDYLHAYQMPGEIAELNSEERQDLLSTLMEELGIAITPEEVDKLLDKDDLAVNDLISSFELGDPIGDEE